MNHNAVTATNPMGRRKVNGREWRVTVHELLENCKRVNQLLRAIGNRHPNDVETQRAVAQATGEIADGVIGLQELLGYADRKDTKEEDRP